MTIQKALDMADEMKPNMMSRELKIAFLAEIEQIIHREVIMKHEHTQEQETLPEYTPDTDPGTVLVIPAPYDMLYVYWLMSKIDHQNLEMDKFNNDNALFENKYESMCDWYTREHMPLTAMPHYRF